MRIFGKVCAFVAAALLALQAVLVFMGYPLHGVGAGIELLVLGLGSVLDGIYWFPKPKHPFLRFSFMYGDGTKDGFVTRADHTTQIERSLRRPFHTLYVVFFESEKDEATDESNIAGRCV